MPDYLICIIVSDREISLRFDTPKNVSPAADSYMYNRLLPLLQIMTSSGGLFLNKTHHGMYRIDSETQFLSQWKLLYKTLVGE